MVIGVGRGPVALAIVNSIILSNATLLAFSKKNILLVW